MRFSLADIPQQAWKNGGGSTQELAMKTDAQGAMLWRVSLAEISSDGAFSTFPGFACIHCIVSGAGLTLSGAKRLEGKPLQPLHFDGGLELFARLNGGASTAFNLIYDPTAVSAEMQIWTAGSHVVPQGCILLFVLSGSAILQTEGRTEQLEAGQGFHGEAEARVTLSDGGQMVLLTLDPLLADIDGAE
ncbi:Various environmental stresses-induced protein [Phaeobacter sp. CECT 5382]|nr:Various environmental stresses-induced protein [Phaeobacter sp. CECT 5382]